MLTALSIYAVIVTIIAVYLFLVWRACHAALRATVEAVFSATEFRDVLRLRDEIRRSIH